MSAAHALSVGLDSLYGAFLKSHYPYEYYAVCLEYYTSVDKRDLEKIAKLKQEMKHFEISLEDMKFGQNNTCFNIDKENKIISQSLVGVKYINNEVSNYLNENKDVKLNYVDLYLKFKEDKVLNKRHYETLVKISYFKELAPFSRLILLPQLYDLFYKNQFKSNDLESKNKEFNEILRSGFGIKNEINIIPIINKYVNRTTAKTIYIGNKDKLLYEICETIPEINLSLVRRIQNEIEFFGYVVTNDLSDSGIVIGQAIATSQKNNSFLFKNLSSGNEYWISIDEGRKFPNKLDYVIINKAIKKVNKGRNKIFAIEYNIL